MMCESFLCLGIMMILLNGKLSDFLPITDRAIHYGDGCFTTMLIKHGVVCFYKQHVQRLKNDALALKIEGIHWNVLLRSLQQIVSSINDDIAVVKIIITRGSGGRGYSPSGCNLPQIIVASYPYPAHYSTWQNEGIELTQIQQRIGLSSLAGIKHLNRLEQVLIKREIEILKADDGVVCDLLGHLVETSTANLFWRKGQSIFTPDLSFSGVKGVVRGLVIKIANKLGYSVELVRGDVSLLEGSDEIFISNSIVEIAPVRQFEKNRFTNFDASRALLTELSRC